MFFFSRFLTHTLPVREKACELKSHSWPTIYSSENSGAILCCFWGKSRCFSVTKYPGYFERLWLSSRCSNIDSFRTLSSLKRTMTYELLKDYFQTLYWKMNYNVASKSLIMSRDLLFFLTCTFYWCLNVENSRIRQFHLLFWNIISIAIDFYQANKNAESEDLPKSLITN